MRKAVARKDLIAETKVGLDGFSRDEKAVEDLSGGVIQGQQQSVLLITEVEE